MQMGHRPGLLQRKLIVNFRAQMALLALAMGFGIAFHFAALFSATALEASGFGLGAAAMIAGSAVVVGCGLMLFLAASNRVFGPLVRVRRGLEELAQGRPAEAIQLRDGDFFREVVDAYNLVAERERARTAVSRDGSR